MIPIHAWQHTAPEELKKFTNLWVKSWDHVKSVHFKKTFMRSSFLSKLWYFSIQHQLTSKQSQLLLYWKVPQYGRNEDRKTGFLKWTDFRKSTLFLHFLRPHCRICVYYHFTQGKSSRMLQCQARSSSDGQPQEFIREG